MVKNALSVAIILLIIGIFVLACILTHEDSIADAQCRALGYHSAVMHGDEWAPRWKCDYYCVELQPVPLEEMIN